MLICISKIFVLRFFFFLSNKIAELKRIEARQIKDVKSFYN